MGPLTLPASGSVYVEANAFIYTVERVDPYRLLLDPFWREVRARGAQTVTSELTLPEVLIKPLRTADATLETEFRDVLERSPDVRLVAVSRDVIERGAQLRALHNLRTPDAIHAGTALVEGCGLFVTNDPAFRRVPGLNVVVLSDLLTP